VIAPLYFDNQLYFHVHQLPSNFPQNFPPNCLGFFADARKLTIMEKKLDELNFEMKDRKYLDK